MKFLRQVQTGHRTGVADGNRESQQHRPATATDVQYPLAGGRPQFLNESCGDRLEELDTDQVISLCSCVEYCRHLLPLIHRASIPPIGRGGPASRPRGGIPS